LIPALWMAGCSSRPVARFQDLVGHNTFLGNMILAFTICSKKIFLVTTKFGEAQRNLGRHCPRMNPCGYGPVLIIVTLSWFLVQDIIAETNSVPMAQYTHWIATLVWCITCNWSGNKKIDVISAHAWAGLQYMFALQLRIVCFHDDVTTEQADRKFRCGFPWFLIYFSVEMFKLSR